MGGGGTGAWDSFLSDDKVLIITNDYSLVIH